MKKNLWKDLIAAVCVLICIIISVKQCRDNNHKSDVIAAIKTKADSDSIEAIKSQMHFDSTIASANAVHQKDRDQRIADQDSIKKLNVWAAKLIAKHKDIQPATDTNTMTVPTEFVSDCHDCFEGLQKEKDANEKLMADINKEDSSSRAKDTAYVKRIDQLTVEKNKVQTNLNNCLKAQLPNDVLEAKLLLNVGFLSINRFLPSAAGGGASYQDFRGRIFAANVMGSKQGPIYILTGSTTIFNFKKHKR